MKKTILIIGASSFVGSNLAQFLKHDFRVVGTYNKTPIEIPGVSCYPCDVLKKDYVNNLIGLIKPDITIYAAGMSSLTECNVFNNLADAINSTGAINCCKSSERYGAKFVYISSAYVLGGEDILYKEGDTPFPSTVYGNSLSSTEFYVQRSCLNYLILRCSNLYGRSFSERHGNWFEYLQAALAKGDQFPADDNIVTGFLDIFIIAKILKSALDLNVTNRLFHVSSIDWMTRYEFAKMYARAFKKDENLIQKVALALPVGENLRRNSNVTDRQFFKLDTANIEEFLGTKMPKVEDSLQLTYKRLSIRS